ncbi:MAG: serine/threonine protein kinase [Deltaproteobacteria bacterium]|nr:MAG: serine/threonine protein kinase [Deltaproteobacteria bacterium]
MGDLSEHFSSSEFACHCGCGTIKASPSILALLEEIRSHLGHPLLITSGSRCRKHNKGVGGSERSAHLTGHAADLSALGGLGRYRILSAAINAGATRIGVGKNFIHVDTASRLPTPRLWTY